MRFLLFFVSFFCLSSQAVVYPYQNCGPTNEKFTRDVITELTQDTEAEFCFTCEQQKNGNDVYMDIKELQDHFKGSIPRECFLAMSARGNRYNKLFASKQYVKCPSKESTRRRGGIGRFCANEDYINLIHHAFSTMAKCFDFNQDRQKEALALINQESAGVLNIQSPSGARCLGQITKEYVKTINSYITSRNSEHPEIYQEALQTCPQIKSLVLSTKKVMGRNAYLTCRSTRDPYTCLFYTFFGLERNHREMKDRLNSPLNYMGTREFSDEDEKKFKLPVKLNEMLRIEAKVSGRTRTMLFWDDTELFSFLKRAGEIEILNTEKVPLFQKDENIETMFNYWAHNGGGTYARHRMVSMVENLKRQLSSSECPPGNKQLRCRLREQIKNRESLSAIQALPMFEYDLKANYPSKSSKRRKEVSNYVRHLIRNNKKVFGYEKNSDGTNVMIDHYRKSFRYRKKNLHLSRESADEFQQLVDEKCPKLDFPI